MAAETWKEFYRRVLEHEAKVCEDVPGDAGGPTKWGITIFDYAEAVGKKVPMLNKNTIDRQSPVFKKLQAELYDLSPEWIENRYRTKYWDGVRADELPRGVDYVVADFGVNCGPGLAVMYLQRIAGNKETGRMDDETIREIATIPAPEIINHFSDMRVAYYEDIIRREPKQIKFKRGWMNRARDVRQAGLTWAAQEPQPASTPMAKAYVAEATAAAPSSTWGQWFDWLREMWKSRTNKFAFGGIGLWIEKKFNFIRDSLPDAQESVSSVVDPLTSLASVLRVNLDTIIFGAGIVALLIMLSRHTNEKVTIKKLKEEGGFDASGA